MDPASLSDIRAMLIASPLFHITLTLGAYLVGKKAQEKANFNPLVNPVLIAMGVVIGVLIFGDVDYAQYFEGAQFIHFLLGPATVALAIPLYNQLQAIKRSALGLMVAIFCGGAAAGLSAVVIGWALGGSETILASLAPKSVTSPIAMGVAEEIGGISSLTAALVILTGVLGAAVGPWLLGKVGVKDDQAVGLALGAAAHGIGTARAAQISETAAAFSGLAMGLNGLATALLVPLLWRWFMG